MVRDYFRWVVHFYPSVIFTILLTVLGCFLLFGHETVTVVDAVPDDTIITKLKKCNDYVYSVMEQGIMYSDALRMERANFELCVTKFNTCQEELKATTNICNIQNTQGEK